MRVLDSIYLFFRLSCLKSGAKLQQKFEIHKNVFKNRNFL